MSPMDPTTATVSQRNDRVDQLLSVLRLMGEAQEGLASLPLSLRAIAASMLWLARRDRCPRAGAEG